MYTYLDENFEKIRDVSKVLCVKPIEKEGKFALYAIISHKPGKYEFVQLTKPLPLILTPFEPMIYFQQQVGRFYMQNFIVLENYYAFNKKHFNGLGHTNFPNKNKCVLYAKFKDGSGIYMASHKRSRFIERQFENLQKDLLKNGINLKNNATSKTPPLIENFTNRSYARIPEIYNHENEME